MVGCVACWVEKNAETRERNLRGPVTCVLRVTAWASVRGAGGCGVWSGLGRCPRMRAEGRTERAEERRLGTRLGPVRPGPTDSSTRNPWSLLKNVTKNYDCWRAFFRCGGQSTEPAAGHCKLSRSSGIRLIVYVSKACSPSTCSIRLDCRPVP